MQQVLDDADTASLRTTLWEALNYCKDDKLLYPGSYSAHRHKFFWLMQYFFELMQLFISHQFGFLVSPDKLEDLTTWYCPLPSIPGSHLALFPFFHSTCDLLRVYI